MTETYHGFVDTAFDALLLFDACCNGLLPRVQRRFGDRERQTIRPGAVYVWDEEETGMRRWTDGRTWSPSRVHGCFLIYYELEGRRHQFVNRNGQGAGRRARNSPRSAQSKASSSSPSSSPSSSLFASYDPCPPNVVQKEQGLIKKALSLCTNNKKRLHLVCYYSREDVESGRLVSPTNDPRFAGVQVQEERYPELANGLGRFDRYGSSRARSSGGSRLWKVASPESSPGRWNAPAAYMGSPASVESRPGPCPTDMHRSPGGFGPYSGQPHPADGLASSTVGPGTAPPPPLTAPPPPPFLVPPSHPHMYGLPSPCTAVTEPPRPEAGEYCQERPAARLASAPYIQHAHVYSTAPLPAMGPPGSGMGPKQQQPQQQRLHHQALPPSQAPPMPMWQRSEAPQAYAIPPHAGPRRASHAPPEASWGDGTKGLMIQTSEGTAMPTFQAPHPHPHPHPQRPVIKLPPIERLQVGPAIPAAWGKGGEGTALTAEGANRMNSEDMRLLASFRLSLQ
ncbi:Gluconate transport-inducing protein [Coemansia biformis]|uniref:Gluconate transport-inducing protein n=1 Tax=Coemansia biformis TaxID=1286918 RepID=A0A9W7Y863_9FUNG|nr:Gluconate transport-inducing protein [Coemansia biformis]